MATCIAADRGVVNQRIAVPAGFMALVASFVALAPLSTDFYLPVLPSMSLALDASASQTQLVITAVLLGMALGQLVGGPLSDQRGRRGTLIAGLLALFLGIFLAFFLDYFEIAFIIIPLLAPAAEKLGIDLIWFGVLLGANMQTSFMHPPFGFALFYLRGIAPREVKSSDIYWGALPWVALQLILVAILIFWPGLVTDFVPKGPEIDPTNVEIRLDTPPASVDATTSETPPEDTAAPTAPAEDTS